MIARVSGRTEGEGKREVERREGKQVKEWVMWEKESGEKKERERVRKRKRNRYRHRQMESETDTWRDTHKTLPLAQ